MPWSLALRMAALIAVAAWTATVMLILPERPSWGAPVLVYLALRLLADAARAFLPKRVGPRVLGALLSAGSWAYLPFGAHVLFAPQTGVPLWLLGLVLLVGGLALATQHERLHDDHPGTARVLGLVGLAVAAPGLALATTALPLAGPWNAVVPVAAAGLCLLLAVFLRPGQNDATPGASELRSWLRRHAFRLALLGLLVVTWLLVRRSLVEVVPFLPLWEFAASVALAGYVLWSLRSFLRPGLLDDPVSSPHTRHETTVARQGEPEMEAWEVAFGEFLESGEHARLNQLVVRLEREDDVPARRAFSNVLTHRAPHGVLLMNPVWPYLAQVLTLLVLAYGVHHYAVIFDRIVPGVAAGLGWTVLAVGLWLLQFNRHGGPWWIKTFMAYAGLALLPFIELRLADSSVPGPLTLLATPVGWPVALILVAVPLLHARKTHARPPRYAYSGDDPRAAMRELIGLTHRALVVRTLWMAAVGLVVFFAIAELARVVPDAALLFPLYLMIAVLVLTNPFVTAVGLRAGHRRVLLTSDAEAATRRRHVLESLKRLEEAYQGAGRAL